jgi:hypothetical protein
MAFRPLLPLPRGGARNARRGAVGPFAPVLSAAIAGTWTAFASARRLVGGGEDSAVPIARCAGEADALTLCGGIVWLKDAENASGTPRDDTMNGATFATR